MYKLYQVCNASIVTVPDNYFSGIITNSRAKPQQTPSVEKHTHPPRVVYCAIYSTLRPSQGFWGFREKGYLFSGIWGEGSFIFRDLGRKQGFGEQGAGG